jgi:hypothetical protein
VKERKRASERERFYKSSREREGERKVGVRRKEIKKE